MKKMICFIGFLAAFCAVVAFAGETAAPIGKIKTVEGNAVVVRQASEIPATPGMPLAVEDLLKTGKDGAMGVLLNDNTIFSVGPDSELAMKDFQFAPIEGKFGIFAEFIKGTLSYISGIIGKQSPKSVRLETPVGIIGLRGTKFFASIPGK